jgi:acyl-CoA thioester hydrolase
MKSRRNKDYFETPPGAPEPIVVEVTRRIRFSDTDAMAIMWHGRYPLLFEEASEELGRRCGLSYEDFRTAGLYAPIVELHIDYCQSLFLDERITIRAALNWHDGARLNTDFRVTKEDGSLATCGYTIQLFTDAKTGLPCIVSPELLERCRSRWRAGEFRCLP